MKKILLHIGYPKTGTTSLQQEIFATLHFEGKINYLGRVQKNKLHYRTTNDRFIFDFVKQFRKKSTLNKRINLDNSLLVGDKLNVISDEDLTLQSFFQKARYNIHLDPFQYPSKLNKLFGDDVEVTILATIRNQADLIFSCFTQKYPYLRSTMGPIDYKSFIYGRPKNFFNVYNFNKVLNAYKEFFPKSIKILFFEDFLSNPDQYFKVLSSVLPANPNELIEMKNQKHHNRKIKTNDYVVSWYYELTFLGRILSLFNGGKEEYLFNLFKLYNLNSKPLMRFEKRLLLKTKSDKLLLPSPPEKEFIKEMFNDSNREFSRNFNIDEGKLSLFGYT